MIAYMHTLVDVWYCWDLCDAVLIYYMKLNIYHKRNIKPDDYITARYILLSQYLFGYLSSHCVTKPAE